MSPILHRMNSEGTTTQHAERARLDSQQWQNKQTNKQLID